MVETTAVDTTDLGDPDFWRENFGALTISEPLDLARLSADGAWLATRSRGYIQRMAEDGYFNDHLPSLGRMAMALGEGASRCVQLGLPPVFLFVFDEVWQCFYALAPVLESILGRPLAVLPDFWLWHVDPKAAEAGWAPHVDKGARALAPDGRPLALTVWIPLSDATPLNSCIYLLPASRDREYGVPPDKRSHGIDLAQIRALPGAPGDWFCWNQAVLHWGSASSRFAEQPRISMALEFQRGDIAPFNEPLIRNATGLDFRARLWLVAKQIMQYRHMYAVSPRVEAMALAVLNQG